MTRKQYQLLKYIYEYIQEYGLPPKYSEMQKHLGAQSRSSVHQIVSRICEHGALERRGDLNNRNLVVKMTPRQFSGRYIDVDEDE